MDAMRCSVTDHGVVGSSPTALYAPSTTNHSEAALSALPNSSSGHLAGWGWFCVFAAIGAAVALGAVSLGLLAVVPAVIVAVPLLSRSKIRRSAFGLLSGAGFLLLYVAWAQRDGPGTTCWHTATASGCDQHLNPLPWLVLGILFVLAGAAGHASRVSA
jgi:hypothetical protein